MAGVWGIFGSGQAAKWCALVGAVVYLNSLGLQFCFDDQAAIIDNVDLRPNVSVINLLRNDFWGTPMSDKDSHKSYRPLTVATFRLNYMLHELQPLGYHLVNVLLHSAVCYLYVLLCGVVFSEVWPALIAGLLFAVHPIHTEAVSGLVGRADILSGLLFIGSIFAYKKLLLSGKTLAGYLWLTLLLVLASALSKEIGVTAVAICLLYEVLIHRKVNVKDLLDMLGRLKSPPDWFKSLVVRTAIFGFFSLSFLYLRVKLNQTPPLFSKTNNPALAFKTPYRQLHWSYLCFLNIWLLLSPSQLCAEYAMDTIPPISSLTDPRNLLTLATLAGLISMGYYGMIGREPHRRRVLFSLCLMVVPFLPASNLFFAVGFVIAERVLYIPSMGFCMLVAYGAWRIKRRPSLYIAARAGIVFLVLIHGVRTYRRSQDWFNNLSIYQASVETYPSNGKMWGNLGIELDKMGNRSDAETLFRKAINITPHYVTGYMNLGYILKEEKRFTETIEIYRAAAKLVTIGLSDPQSPVNISPKTIKVFTALANLLREHTTDYQEAYEMTRKAVQQEPEWEESHNMMGNCLMKLERHSEAKLAFKRSLKVKPDYAIAQSNLGEAHMKLGEMVEAEKCFREALKVDGNHTLTKFRLAKVIIDSPTKTLRLLLEADKLLVDVIEGDPENGNATFSRGLVQYDLRHLNMSEELFFQALEIAPNDSGSLYNLGVISSEQGRLNDCVQHLQTLFEAHPSHVAGQAQLGTCYLNLKNHEKAHEFLARVLNLEPENQMALQNYGVLLIRINQWQEAISVFRQLSRLYPGDESYREQIAVLEKALKKQQESQNTPEQPNAHTNRERETSSKESLKQPAAHNGSGQSSKQPDVHTYSEQEESAGK